LSPEPKIIHGFLQAPLMTIAANAGVDGAIVIGKLIEQEDLSLGYDAVKGLFFLTMNILNCVAPTSHSVTYITIAKILLKALSKFLKQHNNP
jgi:chaperonin GroEL (HSP60 family)